MIGFGFWFRIGSGFLGARVLRGLLRSSGMVRVAVVHEDSSETRLIGKVHGSF